MSLSLPAFSNAWETSSSEAPRFTSILSCRGRIWFILTRLRLTPVTFLGPVTNTKLLSMTSIMTHFLPFSRPSCFTHNLPTSIAGMFLVSPKNQITTIREYKHNITSWNIWKPSIHHALKKMVEVDVN